jgi:hypothetical protein
MSSYANRQFVTNSAANLRDFQHAARAFVDGGFALAPRLKFQHHVVFSTLGGSNSQLSLVAKQVELPKFQVATETANQYNKKNVIMTGINYQPVTVKFYDDNSGVSRKLWESYYAYTFGDHGAAKAGLYGKSLGPNFTSYGLENEPVVPFLNYVKFHTFAKRGWLGYTLVNPVITAWSSDTFNWSDSSPAEHSVTLAYDAVTFDGGSAGPGSPPGFASGSYDMTPSPLQTPGGGFSPAPGVERGVRNGADQVFGTSARKTDPSNAFTTTSAPSAIKTATNAQYNNLQGLTRQGITRETANAAINNGNSTVSTTGRGNLNNVSFPVYDKDNGSIAASPRKIVGN